MKLRTILVATNASPEGRHAARFATGVASTLGAEKLELMRLGGEPADTQTADPADDLTSGTDVCAIVNSTSNPRPGSILRRSAVTIAERAKELNADLTIVSAQAKGFMAELQMRVRNSELVRKTASSILFLRQPPTGGYTQVLVPVDFSDESRAAAQLAMVVAPSAQFTFLHAYKLQDEGVMHDLSVPPSVIAFERRRAEQRAMAALQEFTAQFSADVGPVTCAVEYGDPVPVVHAYASRMQAQLIAIGRRGHSRLRELFLGSVAQRLVDLVATDLLIASNKADRK